MSTIDEILASGRYTDRRGRGWNKSPYHEWVYVDRGRFWVYTPRQMRLLIERDMHRDECVGIHWCLTHPVESVDYDGVLGLWKVWGPGDWFRGTFGTHAEAMDAARALAVTP